MKTFVKVALSGGLVAGIGGGSYGIYQMTSSKIINKEIFADTLLEDNNKFKETWNSRFEALNKTKNSEIDELKNLNSLADLKKWCNDATERNYLNKEDPVFKAIEKYCTKIIKDTLLPIVEKTSVNNDKAWTRRYEKLKTMNEDLVKELSDIKAGESKSGKDIKDWCTKTYSETYKGMSEKLWKNAQDLCDRREAAKNFMTDANKQLLGEEEWENQAQKYDREVTTDPLNIKSSRNKKETLKAMCESRKEMVVDKEDQEYTDFDKWCTKNNSLG